MIFSLDDPINGEQTPLRFKHMKYLRYVLRTISGWPGQELGESVLRFEWLYAYYNSALAIFYLALGITYLKLHMAELTFYELGHLYLVLMMNILSASRALTLCASKLYRNVSKQFFRELHLIHHKDKSEYAKKMHVRVHFISHYFTFLYSFVMITTVFLFDVAPVINNYLHGKFKVKGNLVNTTYEHAIYLYLPFNSETNFKGYMGASVFIWYGSYLCGTSVYSFDTLLSIMVFTIYGHLKILLRELASFPLPASATKNEEGNSNEIVGSEVYSEEEQKIVSVKLKECIEYHLMIVDFIYKMSEAFGLALLVYYIFHQISGCLLLLECSQMTPEAIARYVPLTVIMFQQLIQMSIIFESVGAVSDRLKDAVYSLPWEYMNTSNRKTVSIFLINVQPSVHVTAGGMINVSVTTMASILKTSFSYFCFLRTVGE